MSKLWAAIRNVLVFLFGNVKWEAPRWLRFIGGKLKALGGWARTHKAPAAGLVLAIAGLSTGGFYGWRWYKNRPRPQETRVTISAPELTRIEEKMRPHPVTLDFDGSAAPLKNVGKLLAAGVEISPKIEGTWKWESDRQLAFQPKNDWPVGQEYVVRLAKKDLVAPHVNLSTYKLEFETARFTVRLAESEFYQDPVDANLKKVVATFSFTHPVDAAQFEKRLKMRFIPSNKDEKEADYKFHVSYDRFKGNAYVHSEPVHVPQKDAEMVITLGSGVAAAKGGPSFDEKLEARVKVPGLYNFLKVQSARLTIVDNEKNEPEQVLVIETSAGVHEQEIAKNVQAWVLPVYDPSDPEEPKKKRPHAWNDTSFISPEILKKGSPLKLSQIASEKEYATLHSFKVRADVGRWIYVKVHKGLRAFGGYVLGDTFDATARVEPYPRQLRILHSGSILSMSGERRLSVFARDVPAVRFEIARVLPDQLHHLFTQSYGQFGRPSFNYNFNEENLADFVTEVRDLRGAAAGKPQYEALDLGKQVKGLGVFVVRAQSWDIDNKRQLGEQDQRLLLVSDLGIVVKENADSTHEVFVQSIHGGDPVGGARVQVIGKNGQQVLSATTDGEGRAQVGVFTDLRRERQPVGWVVSKGRDTSFLPVNRSDRTLDTSRFDVGGVSDYGTSGKSLTAYVFSDRGLYRPGDEIRVGIVVRPRDWREAWKGVPLQVVILDARGLVVRKETIKLGAAGFEELRHTTPEVAPTGTYTINVHTVKDGKPASLIGSTTVRVREFLPDRMKIGVRLSTENPEGWVSPKDLKGRVTLANLFGTPAVGRTVRAQLHLTPALPSLHKWKAYRFSDPMRAKESFNDVLSDGTTNDEGVAEFDLALQRFASATYRLSLLAEGFESEGGRGVAGEVTAIVSPLPYLVGYKPDGDLAWLPKGSEHSVEWVAVGPRGDAFAAKGLKAMLYERKFVSVLTRQDNGTYKYESIKREVELSQKGIEIAAKGTKSSLRTDKPGDFALLIKNDKDEELARVEYSVAGSANLTRDMDKNAELKVQLKNTDVEPGQEMELSIKAPFAGAGLITIEREKVFTHKWFKSDTTASVQRIKLPEGFEGDGYVSVAFVRDPGSDEIFMSPLSYGIVPFSVSRAKRAAKIEVASAELTKPGEPYKMKVTADRPMKVAVFAIDEGILRVADYDTPDPLAFFFRKRALSVRTSQILDLILPEHGKLMAAVAPGGDGDGALGAHLNPFKRKQQKPVAWCSGIVQVGPDGKELTYDVPDYFNGTLRVMAVAVAEEAMGTTEKKTIVRGDFVINPNAPMVLAPGDETEVSASIANNVTGSGKGASVEVGLKVSKHLEIVGGASQKLSIDELREGTAKFKLRATRELGSATLTFTASTGGKSGKLSTDISVRPASPYLVTFQAGHLEDGTKQVDVPRQLFSEYRKLQAGVSHLPLGLTHGLAAYLEKYPHGCTEQMVSQMIPAVALGKRPEFGFSPESAAKTVSAAIATLRTRQNEEGAFGMWAANPHVQPVASVWTLAALTEARERGYSVPADTMKSGMAWLQQIARQDGDSLADERVRAWAIYVLTRNGMVTSGFATALQKHLDNNHPNIWKQDLAGAYLASTYQLLRQDRLARQLMEAQKLSAALTPDYRYYHDGLARDAQLLYLLAKHFPDLAAKISPEQIDQVAQPIFKGSYNTFSSAQAILALEAYGEAAAKPEGGSQAMKELVAGQKRAITLPAGLMPVAEFSDKASAIEFESKGAFGSYWLVAQRGFDLEPAKKGITTKVEVFREYTDAHGKVLDKVVLGEELEVHLRVRALSGKLHDLAIVDLLPGGFEVIVQPPPAREEPVEEGGGDSEGMGEGDGEGEGHDENIEGAGDDTGPDVKEGDVAGGTFALPIALESSTFSPEYGDVREDRVVLFGSAGSDVKEFVYAIKATNVGKYTVPPIQAEGMYDRSVVARGVSGKIEVVPR